jgi:hypothetical protein
MNQQSKRLTFFSSILLLLFLSCGKSVELSDPPAPAIVQNPTDTAAVLPTETLFPTFTSTPTATIFPEPEGCLRPPDDLTRIQVNGVILNQRTYAMLEQAAALYGGSRIDLVGLSITQGSYVDDEPLSFGTHAGGGAVDISVVSLEKWEVLYDEVPSLIHALRVAGFAAWLREYGELAPDSPVHIHAIAIGDPQLSPAAEDQLTGPYGYFHGFNGLPQESGIPVPDPHGGPVFCNWMFEMGYTDLQDQD